MHRINKLVRCLLLDWILYQKEFHLFCQILSLIENRGQSLLLKRCWKEKQGDMALFYFPYYFILGFRLRSGLGLITEFCF